MTGRKSHEESLAELEKLGRFARYSGNATFIVEELRKKMMSGEYDDEGCDEDQRGLKFHEFVFGSMHEHPGNDVTELARYVGCSDIPQQTFDGTLVLSVKYGGNAFDDVTLVYAMNDVGLAGFYARQM